MISIIIPVKGHRIIDRLLTKLSEIPKPEDTEILVIDAAKGTLNDIKNKFPLVRWLYYKSNYKQSISEQRNFGLLKSKGDIIVFIDADCIPTNSWLLNLINPIRKDNESVTSGKIISMSKYPLKWKFDYELLKSTRYLLFIPTMNSAFLKRVFNQIGGFDNIFKYGGEDGDISIRLHEQGFKIRYVHNAEIYHDWGDINKNIKRIFLYGRANFVLIFKHKYKLFKYINLIEVSAFPIYLFFLPITLFWPLYLLFLIIPFFKGLIKSYSLTYALESVVYGLLMGSGFIFQFVNSLFLPKQIQTVPLIKVSNISHKI